MKTDSCLPATGREDVKDIRKSDVDYDGDGDVEEGIYGEIATLKEALYAALQSYGCWYGWRSSMIPMPIRISSMTVMEMENQDLVKRFTPMLIILDTQFPQGCLQLPVCIQGSGRICSQRCIYHPAFD